MDLAHIVEEKIKKAVDQGDLDDLPGKGRPLPEDEFAHVPDDLRNSYRVLKNAGMLPEEMQIKKEVVELEELLDQIADPEEKERTERKLTEKRIRFQMLMEKRKMAQSGTFGQYESSIRKRL
ncbi:DnaJ family domain-containing protein [Salimicrobium salexigens]|uniref:DnaJ homologue subfamily C member 28 conserved domain-containing protein n=1 Tax=Salimicrobium salexigens TaxID=908941 RepID=A0ABY1KTZ2_9BACI|nr:DnaJ family domain-containing protein [Salimicrobium salexigens]SIS77630.1 protein of unknown function [Salimicrobium salexigens]